MVWTGAQEREPEQDRNRCNQPLLGKGSITLSDVDGAGEADRRRFGRAGQSR